MHFFMFDFKKNKFWIYKTSPAGGFWNLSSASVHLGLNNIISGGIKKLNQNQFCKAEIQKLTLCVNFEWEYFKNSYFENWPPVFQQPNLTLNYLIISIRNYLFSKYCQTCVQRPKFVAVLDRWSLFRGRFMS